MTASKAQIRAVSKYKDKNYKRIPLDVNKEFYTYLKGIADSQGKSVNGFIKEAINEKCENITDEIPSDIIPKLISWLTSHGHSEAESLECIKYISE